MKSQRGVALIIVILAVALVASVAAAMAQQQSLWQLQIESGFDRAQAIQLGHAGIDWARAVLADDARSSSLDHEDEIWAKRLPAMPVDGGEVTGFIEDQQGRFNLNNLVRSGSTSPAYVAQFRRLLDILGLPAELAGNLADWLDSDSDPQTGGAEDSYYLGLPTPYRCANRPLTELGELSLVKGFNAQTIERLRPYVAALPQATAINVNFASPEVLASVIGKLTLSDARLIVQARHGNPFRSVEDFSQRLPHGGMQVVNSDLSVSSQFFMATGRAKIGQSQITVQALLQRTANWPQVIWQNVL